MKIVRKEMREEEVVEDMVCNRCGKFCKILGAYFVFAQLNVRWGYGSGKDGEQHESHLCEACYDQIVAGFKVPPAIKGGFIDLGDFGWPEDTQAKEAS